MAVYLTKSFDRFLRKERIEHDALCSAVTDVAEGRADANLGGGVFKQRLARAGGGKSGGYRAILYFKAGPLAIFVHGFAKSEKENISRAELDALKRLAREVLAYSPEQFRALTASGVMIEVTCDDEP